MERLWVLRVFLVLLMVGVVLYALNQEVDGWGGCDRWTATWDDYTLPAAQRQPALSMKEFYAVEDRGLLDMMMKTRLTFKAQNHLGTVLRDGFHIDLPENTMWRGGKLVRGEEVRQQMELARRPLHQPPAPTTSPLTQRV